MSAPRRRGVPLGPLLLAAALAGSNWLLWEASPQRHQISGNGIHPLALLAFLLSLGLAGALGVFLWRWAGALAAGMRAETRRLTGGAGFFFGVQLAAWGVVGLGPYTALLPYMPSANWGWFNQYTLGYWATAWPFWAGLLLLNFGIALLRQELPASWLAAAALLVMLIAPSVIRPVPRWDGLTLVIPERTVAAEEVTVLNHNAYAIRQPDGSVQVFAGRYRGQGSPADRQYPTVAKDGRLYIDFARTVPAGGS